MMSVCARCLLLLLCTGFTLLKQSDASGCNCTTSETCVDGSITYTCKCPCRWNCEENVNWTPPSGWTGPTPALYYSFETTSGFTLMAGTQESNINPLVTGKEMKAIRLDATQRQWIDLGMQDVCLAQPDCGSEGGALSMWVKVGTGGYTGIITSRQNAYPVRGFTLGRSGNYIMTLFYVPGGSFFLYGTRPSDDWFHIVINYFGPNNGQGFKTYFNGNLRITDNTKWQHNTTPSNGKIVIGRFFADIDNYYTSMDVDELLFFNHTLTTQEINSLYNI